MLATLRVPALVLIGTIALAGCANDQLFSSANLTTASVPETPRVDPACSMLTAQIDGLRREGVADKIEKAAQKKYKLTVADTAKADQLTKANAEFQAKCSAMPRTAAATTGASGVGAAR